MRKLFLASAFLAASLVGKAGSDVKKFSVGADVGALYSGGEHLTGFGASGKYLFDLEDGVGITASLGVMSFKNFTLIPIKAGYRRAIGNSFYVEGQLGYSKYSFNQSNNTTSNGGALTYAGNLGMLLGGDKVDISFRYEQISKLNLTLIGLRAAYCF